MSKFIYVFEKKAAKDLTKRGFQLLKMDDENQIWIFANKDPDKSEFDFTFNYQMVLSDVISL